MSFDLTALAPRNPSRLDPARLLARLGYPATLLAGFGLYGVLQRAGASTAWSTYAAIALGILMILTLEWLLPFRRAWRPDLNDRKTDVMYLALVQIALPSALTVAAATWVAGRVRVPLWPRGLPVATQFLIMLTMADFLRYGLHVACHRFEPLWRIHAVHHAPTKLYAQNVARFHPAERTLQFMLEGLPFVALGVDPRVLSLYAVFHSLHGFFQHANVDVRLGFLNLVVSGPELHRWHHSVRPSESNHNYANHLAVWDFLFGTFFLPRVWHVGEIGLQNRCYPQRFSAQLRAPLARDLDQRERPLPSWREIVLGLILRFQMRLLSLVYWRPLVAAARRPAATQLRVLRRILAAQRNTRFGREHGFASIRSVEEFRRRVSVQTYESISAYIDEQEKTGKPALNAEAPLFYARTSGTTGAPRHLPITPRSLKEHQRAQRLFAYVQHRAVPEAYDGKILAIVSPAVEGRLPTGTPFGSMSGHLYQSMPRLAKLKYAIPAEVFALADYDLKYLLILRLSLPLGDLSAVGTANPSTLLKLLDTLRVHRETLLADLEHGTFSRVTELPDSLRKAIAGRLGCQPRRLEELRRVLSRPAVSLADLWPDLRLVSTWTGGNCGIALERVRKLLPDRARVVELGYLASEFRGSVTVDPQRNLGLPTLQENFFEFVEKDQWECKEKEFLTLEQLEPGREYYPLVTTSAGLYRYFINDIVRVTGRFQATPTIEFVQKGKGVTSITGEKLYEGQVLDAVATAQAELAMTSRFFVLLADVETAGYRLLIEAESDFAPKIELLGERIDERLSAANLEYGAKRASGRLGPLQARRMRAGFGEAVRAACIAAGQREGQLKCAALQYVTDFRCDENAWITEERAR
jgi:sterol desaturase/sphingolipid hydroxylase (fatty acid hydroxylase superfamily)